ncbi:MAG: prenyltransferase/squalene oxidase repeat-containing protein [Phycisphaerae bacterium]
MMMGSTLLLVMPALVVSPLQATVTSETRPARAPAAVTAGASGVAHGGVSSGGVSCRAVSSGGVSVRGGAAVSATQGGGEGGPTVLGRDVVEDADAAVERGLRYLAASQNRDGAWEAFGRSHPAITALAAKCLVQDRRYGPTHPASRRALAYVLRFVHPDGGIYQEDEGLRNYQTSVALMALSAARDPTHAAVIRRARAFLQKLQWDEGEGHDPTSTWYGGQGYGRHKRPDLSNTQLMLEALRQSGLPPDDPTYRKALRFVTRCQMLGETNDRPFARRGGDGGFIYSPVGDGESKAGTELVGGRRRLRSYGSMTYAGFKSMLYANVDRRDVRVRQALDWIRRHYTLDHNANMPLAQSDEGLYYYYHVFARALHAWGEPRIVDTAGTVHVWRDELCRKLVSLQQPDGSWVNERDRWYEGNPHLVTAYAILAIQTALPD